ncbi:hypothetical protein MKW98_008900 [Papaver atlanticum]|uniref:Replication factor A C-terminal domain-containing protein n=1 Tax=Papaver atlanticum TaxID=357466 RepID=A0AAD4S2U2_9MAGN|nr:hypothetical protein MKW98_008900 [Papaver atlanticum]
MCYLANGWHYLACHRCSKKVMGDDGDLWCTKCEAKVELPIARFMVRFEVEDHTGTTVFVALDSEVQKLVRATAAELTGASEDNAKSAVISGFSQILQRAVDFQITIHSFNMKQKTPTSFTVTRINFTNQPGQGFYATVKVEGDSNTVDGPHTKKPRLDETTGMEDNKDEAAE